MYEIHIAIPHVEDASVLEKVYAELKKAGIEKVKNFLNVINLDGPFSRPETPPTGHDLEHPAGMATIKTPEQASAIQYARSGMAILREFNLEGNFEIECWAQDTHIAFNPLLQLPEFTPVQDSPGFETHAIWKGTLEQLPTYEEMAEKIKAAYGYAPHQIVDFSREHDYTGAVSRVATIYQPNREAALECEKVLQNKLNSLGCAYVIAEQVLLVGQWPE